MRKTVDSSRLFAICLNCPTQIHTVAQTPQHRGICFSTSIHTDLPAAALFSAALVRRLLSVSSLNQRNVLTGGRRYSLYLADAFEPKVDIGSPTEQTLNRNPAAKVLGIRSA